MFGSVVYHLFNSLLLSAGQYWTLLQFDITGIWLANSLNTFNYLYLSFYCDHSMRYAAMTIHGLIVAGTLFPSLRAKTPLTRAIALSLFLFMRVFTTVSRQLVFTGMGAQNSAWYYYSMTDVFLFIGAVVNAARMPEKIWPGRFDLLFTRSVYEQAATKCCA